MASIQVDFVPLAIEGVVDDEALDELGQRVAYDVTLRLNREPDAYERGRLTEVWGTQRPQLAVTADRLVLHDTTIELVRDQVRTLLLDCLRKVNRHSLTAKETEAIRAEKARLDALPIRQRVVEIGAEIDWSGEGRSSKAFGL